MSDFDTVAEAGDAERERRKYGDTDEPFALAYPCPRCHAEPHRACVTITAHPDTGRAVLTEQAPHDERWDAMWIGLGKRRCPDGCGKWFTADQWQEHAADPHYAMHHRLY